MGHQMQGCEMKTNYKPKISYDEMMKHKKTLLDFDEDKEDDEDVDGKVHKEDTE